MNTSIANSFAAHAIIVDPCALIGSGMQQIGQSPRPLLLAAFRLLEQNFITQLGRSLFTLFFVFRPMLLLTFNAASVAFLQFNVRHNTSCVSRLL